MRNSAKVVHLVGLAMFLGSILGHIALGVVPGIADSGASLLFAREAIAVATWGLTVPGLALLVASGAVLTVRGGYGFGRWRWLGVHQALAALIVLNAALILVPVGGELLEVAAEIARGAGSRDAYAALAAREHTFGPINLALTLATLVVAVFKPRFGQRRG